MERSNRTKSVGDKVEIRLGLNFVKDVPLFSRKGSKKLDQWKKCNVELLFQENSDCAIG